MKKSEIKTGKEYVLRDKKGLSVQNQHIKSIEYIRGKKWKAEWIELPPILWTEQAGKEGAFRPGRFVA